MEFGMNNTVITLVLLFVGVVVVSAVLIPITIDLVGGEDNNYVEVGSEFSYTPTANLDNAEFTFSGSAMDMLTVSSDGTTVSGTLDTVGSYTLVITATTTQPTQTVTQTYSLVVQEGSDAYQETRPLLLLIPTMMIVGLITWGVRRFTGGSLGGDGGESYDGFSLGDSGIAGDFGRGFGKR